MAETPEYGCVNELGNRVCDLEDEKHSWDDLEHNDTVVTTNIIQLNHLCLQFHYGNYKDCFGLVELQRIRKSVSSQQPQNPDKNHCHYNVCWSWQGPQMLGYSIQNNSIHLNNSNSMQEAKAHKSVPTQLIRVILVFLYY